MIQIQEDLPQEKADNEEDPEGKKAVLKGIVADDTTRYPRIVEALTPQTLLLPELSTLQALVPSLPGQMRESATAQLLPAHPELIFRLSFTLTGWQRAPSDTTAKAAPLERDIRLRRICAAAVGQR